MRKHDQNLKLGTISITSAAIMLIIMGIGLYAILDTTASAIASAFSVLM
jgi:hypothetical protein